MKVTRAGNNNFKLLCWVLSVAFATLFTFFDFVCYLSYVLFYFYKVLPSEQAASHSFYF